MLKKKSKTIYLTSRIN